MAARCPVFLTTLQYEGWDAAKKRIGGTTARNCGEYISTLNYHDATYWVRLINANVPSTRYSFHDDVLAAFTRLQNQNAMIAQGMVAIPNSVIAMDCQGTLHPP